MNTHLSRLVLPVLMLILAACGSGGGAGQPGPGEPGPPPGDNPNRLSGRLVAEGTSQVHTLDLTAGAEWQQRLGSSVYEAVAVHLPANELMIANTSMGSPLTVATYDLDNFALKRSFVWPGTGDRDYARVNGLAVSRDGLHFAVVIEGIGTEFLEVINTQTREVLFSGSLGLAGTDLIWLADNLLAFSAHLNHPEWAGGIVAVTLDELANGGDTVSLGVIMPFDSDEWTFDQPFDFAFSPDMEQLAYAYNSDIWVKDLTDSTAAPRQLTTGPTGLAGPTFSPDGRYLALVERQSYSLQDTFVIPLDLPAPVFIDGANSGTDVLLLEADTLVDVMLVWQP